MSAGRRIRRLHLGAPDERLVRRGALLVEDALATATLPVPEPGRLLLIRSLDLGRIRAGASPSSVALRLEARLREMAASAVWAGDPAASAASAVRFRDPTEAVVLLARRLARGQDAAAWFWRRAVPAWQPEAPLPAALRGLLHIAQESPARAAAAVELVRALFEEDALEPLAAGLTPADGPFLLRASGWASAPGPPPAGLRSGELAPGARSFVRRCAGRWGSEDGRAVWLTAALLAAERPARLADPRLLARARQAIASALDGLPQVSRERPASVAASSLPPGEPSPSIPLPPPLPPTPGEGRLPPERPDYGQRQSRGRRPGSTEGREPEASEGSAEPATSRRSSSISSAAGFGGEPTAFAGLFLFLPVFAKLGIVEFLEVHPHLGEVALAGRILDRLACRLGAAADDPVRRVLELPAIPPESWSFTVPERWRELAAPRRPSPLAPLPPPLAPTPGASPGEDGGRGDPGEGLLLDAWLTAARRWCRRSARIGLASLVRRPGLVAATRTHLDLTFELRRADIRIRRAGLDLDPGWLPWFGRVVQFHYERLEVRDGKA